MTDNIKLRALGYKRITDEDCDKAEVYMKGKEVVIFVYNNDSIVKFRTKSIGISEEDVTTVVCKKDTDRLKIHLGNIDASHKILMTVKSFYYPFNSKILTTKDNSILIGDFLLIKSYYNEYISSVIVPDTTSEFSPYRRVKTESDYIYDIKRDTAYEIKHWVLNKYGLREEYYDIRVENKQLEIRGMDGIWIAVEQYREIKEKIDDFIIKGEEVRNE